MEDTELSHASALICWLTFKQRTKENLRMSSNTIRSAALVVFALGAPSAALSQAETPIAVTNAEGHRIRLISASYIDEGSKACKPLKNSKAYMTNHGSILISSNEGPIEIELGSADKRSIKMICKIRLTIESITEDERPMLYTTALGGEYLLAPGHDVTMFNKVKIKADSSQEGTGFFRLVNRNGEETIDEFLPPKNVKLTFQGGRVRLPCGSKDSSSKESKATLDFKLEWGIEGRKKNPEDRGSMLGVWQIGFGLLPVPCDS